MNDDTNDVLITENFIKEINATIYEYFNDVNIFLYIYIIF